MELELWGMSFNYCLEKWFIPGNYIIHFSFTYCKKRNANFGKTEPRKSLFFFFFCIKMLLLFQERDFCGKNNIFAYREIKF